MKILIACGGTGGHFFPALSFIQALKKRLNDPYILVVLTKNQSAHFLNTDNIKIARISAVPIYKNINFRNIFAVLRLFFSALETLIILFTFNPDVIFGFGGYASFFLVFFGHIFGKRTLIHEQNVVPGLANRFLARFADRIAISFLQTKDFLSFVKEKTVFTGYPLRQDLIRIEKNKALSFFGFSEDRVTLLVVGGSQGSHKINICVADALYTFEQKHKLQLIHLSGKSDYAYLRSFYALNNIKAVVFDFLKEMNYAYSAADFAIARAGAGTVMELAYFKIPVFFIPYPYAAGHQKENAKVLQDNRTCIIIEDKEINAQRIKMILSQYLDNPAAFIYQTTPEIVQPQAAESLVDLIISLS